MKTLRKDGRLTTSAELFYGKKPKLTKFRVLFCPCVVKKHTYYKKTAKGDNILTEVKPLSQRGFRAIFVGLDEYSSGYQVYVPTTRQLVTSSDVVFDEDFTTALVHKHQSYKEALKVRSGESENSSFLAPSEHTGDITTIGHPLARDYNGTDNVEQSINISKNENK